MNINITARFRQQSQITPNKVALSYPLNKRAPFRYGELSFKELEERANNLAYGIDLLCKEQGHPKGSKVLVFVKPGQHFPVVTFALFKLGLIPIFIDPGMGRKNLLKAVETIRPDILIAEPIIHIFRPFFKKSFASIKTAITTGQLKWGKIKRLDKLLLKNSPKTYEAQVLEEDPAAILFTSGGTGTPKGVLYTHGIFNQQVDVLKEMFQLTTQDIDIPGFPLFALFTLTMGLKCSVPAMNPSRPAKANPKYLVQNIIDQKGTFIAGSPAIWERVADYCLKNDIQLPSVKYVVMFGAPVKNQLHRKFQKILPNGDTYTPYGATECLPVSNASGKNLLANINKTTIGTCIGLPAPKTEILVIKITDDILMWEDLEICPVGEVGEIIVHSPMVTPKYIGMKRQTSLAKIKDPNGRLWHRMGDIGLKDQEGQLWFCGRKGHRVILEDKRTLPSIPTELVFNSHPEIKRTALIPFKKDGKKTAALVIERHDKKILKGRKKISFEQALVDIAKEYPQSRDINTFFYQKNFPVDVRHNIKINREQLASLANQGNL
jgi:olefin beta-lactone synthetase